MHVICSYIYILLFIINHRKRSEANLMSNVQETDARSPLGGIPKRIIRVSLNTSKSAEPARDEKDHSTKAPRMKGPPDGLGWRGAGGTARDPAPNLTLD